MYKSEYKVVEASTNEQLSDFVNSSMQEGWTPQGGPFVVPWSPGHGLIHALATFNQETEAIYVTICQAMMRYEENETVLGPVPQGGE